MIRNNVLAFIFHIAASITAVFCIILLSELFNQYNTAAAIAVAIFGIIVYLLYILFGYFFIKKQKSWVKDLLSLISVLVFCLAIWVIYLQPVTRRAYDGSFTYETDMRVYILSANMGFSAPLILFGDIDIESEKYLASLLSLLPYLSLFLGLRLKTSKFMNSLFKRKEKSITSTG